MPTRPPRLVVLLAASALLFAGAVVLSACGSGSSNGGATPSDKGTPTPGGTFVFPLPGEPVSIEPLDAQDASGLQVAHQVFQGLTKWVLKADGDAGHRAGHRREVGVDRRADLDLPPEARGDVPGAGEPTGHRPGLRRLLDRVTDPDNQSYVAYILAPLEGCDDRGYQTDPAKGLTGVTAIDDVHTPGQAPLSLRRLPATLGHPVAAVTPVEYIERVGDKAFAHKPVGTGAYAVASWHHGRSVRLVQEHRVLGHGGSRVGRRGRHADHRRPGRHVGALPEGDARLLPGARPSR